MSGFNGGLIGKNNLTAATDSIPGVWTLKEQEIGIRAGRWAGLAGLLDTYPAALAYSLRTLRAGTATSPVVRVRRSNDSSEQDFTSSQITDGTLASFCGANSGFVRTWYDQSGNSNHGVQTTTAAQPRIVNAGVVDTEAGRPAIVWPSVGHGLNFTLRITTVRTYILLARCSNTLLGEAPFLLGDGTEYQYHAGNGTWLDSGYSPASVKNGDNRLNGTSANFATTQRGSSRYIFTMIHTANAPASALMTDRGANNRSWVGPIQEVIIYTTDQGANRAAIETNINAHYSVF